MTTIVPKPRGEHTIKEFPNITYWLENGQALGKGNLILTSERLLFLNRVQLSPEQKEQLLNMYKADGFSEAMEYALKLHKKNFQIPLANIDKIRLGLFRFFPFPRFHMKVFYHGNKRNSPQLETGFFFRLPPYRIVFQFELTFVINWINAVKSAVKKAKQPAS